MVVARVVGSVEPARDEPGARAGILEIQPGEERVRQRDGRRLVRTALIELMRQQGQGLICERR